MGTLSINIKATDGAGENVTDSFDITVANTNDAPTLTNAIANQSATEDAAFSYTVPANTFADVDVGDTLTYSATQANGSALPTWLTFNAITRTFSGTPLNNDVGTLSLKVMATDGTGENVTDSFDITVANTNDAPLAVANIVTLNENATSANLVASLLADDSDVDVGDTLRISAVNTTGTAGTVTFNAALQTLTYSASAATHNALAQGASATDSFTYTAADGSNATATATVTVTVTGVNDAPTVANALPDQSAVAGAVFSYAFTANAFSDVDVGDVLAYSATRADGSALPVWLSFNPATRTFSGTPATPDAGTLSVKVTATDPHGLLAADLFDISVGASSTLTGTAGADTLTGTAANNLINGLGGNDTLNGLGGDDTLNGGAGNDSMAGGTGSDTYVIDSPSDIATEAANQGIDTVNSSVTRTLGANLENLTLTGANAINGTGNALDNVLRGNSGANVLSSGAGNDTYYVSSGDTVTESNNQGTDSVYADVSWTLGNNIENLTLTSSAAINGAGNALNNVITGNAGNNTLNGGAGADTLVGGAGNDTYVVDNSSDVVTENLNEGTDAVQASVTYTLSANVENLTLTGTAAISGTGNALDNLFTGNAGNNTLTGGEGNDTLNGGAGADRMAGGLGNDSYVVNVTGDTVTEAAGQGTDNVQAGVTYTLSANVENLLLTGSGAINGTGNALDNILIGNSGANLLTGLAGNDTYFIAGSDSVTESAGGGEDTVYSSVTHTLAANVENLILTGTAVLGATGNTLNNLLRGNAGINALTGRTGNDMIEGGDGIDILSGSGGNNYLNGQAGADALIGGGGNEIFIGGTGNDAIITGSGADIIAFNRGDGSDTVAPSINQNNTVSLGGGITYANLFFQKSGNNLILKTAGSAASESLTFANWYASTTTHSMLNLQIVAEASADFDASSANPLRNKKVAEFNFGALANQFDAARAATPGLSAWALSNGLAAFHLSGSDSAALGGDLAYQYGLYGSLANVGTLGAQNVLGDAQFGSGLQALQAQPNLQAGIARLS